MYAIPFVQRATGTDLDSTFEVRRILCIGRNYADHAIEMGHDPNREPPFFFFKPLSALNQTGQLALPGYSNNVQYELELVLALNQGGKNLNPKQAQGCIGGAALGLDMTCRDIQQQAKQAGRPWELAKGFDQSAPVTAISQGNYDDLDHIGEMYLEHNGRQVQHTHWRNMIWSPTELLQQISQFIALQAGDLIFTGTPAGVGPVVAGDQLVARADGLCSTLSLNILPSQEPLQR